MYHGQTGRVEFDFDLLLVHAYFKKLPYAIDDAENGAMAVEKSSDVTRTVNWRHNTSTQIPLSAGFGKVWKFSERQAIDTSFPGEWMADRQFSTQIEQFALRFKVTAPAAIATLIGIEPNED